MVHDFSKTNRKNQIVGAGCDPSRCCTYGSGPADRRSVAEATMWAGKIVVQEPGRELLIALFGVGRDLSTIILNGNRA